MGRGPFRAAVGSGCRPSLLSIWWEDGKVIYIAERPRATRRSQRLWGSCPPVSPSVLWLLSKPPRRGAQPWVPVCQGSGFGWNRTPPGLRMRISTRARADARYCLPWLWTSQHWDGLMAEPLVGEVIVGSFCFLSSSLNVILWAFP